MSISSRTLITSPSSPGRHTIDIPDQLHCFAYIHRSFVVVKELM
jgi:hypothetical protein